MFFPPLLPTSLPPSHFPVCKFDIYLKANKQTDGQTNNQKAQKRTKTKNYTVDIQYVPIFAHFLKERLKKEKRHKQTNKQEA